MSPVMLYDRTRPKKGDAAADGGDGCADGAAPGGMKSDDARSKKSSDILTQARASLLEANISGASVREAQELFKKALNAHRDGDYDRAMDLSWECIDLVDTVMKNE